MSEKRVFYLWKFNKTVDDFKKIYFNTETIDDLCELIQDKDVLQVTQKLLDTICEYMNVKYSYNNKIVNRLFLSVYIIDKYPEQILNTHALSDIIYKQSKKIIDIIYKTDKLDIEELYEKIAFFSYIFNRWKEIDRVELTKELVYRYIELEKINDDLKLEDKEETVLTTIQNIKDEQTKLKKNIQKYNGGTKLLDTQMKNYNNLKAQMKSTMQQSFWNLFEKEISEQNFKPIIQIIKDIVSIMLELLPNRIDLVEDLTENIDIELIEQMIDNKAIDNDYIYKMMKYILAWCQRLDSADNENKYQIMLKKMDEDFEKGFEYKTFFTEMFREIMEKLDSIKERTMLFRDSDEYKQMLKDMNMN